MGDLEQLGKTATGWVKVTGRAGIVGTAVLRTLPASSAFDDQLNQLPISRI